MSSFRLCICWVVVCFLLPRTPATPLATIPKSSRNLTSQHMEAVYAAIQTPKMRVKFTLAKSYGNLDASSLNQLDETLKVMMGEILKLDLENVHTWEEMMNKLEDCPYMVRDSKKSIARRKSIDFDSTKVLGIGGDKTRRVHDIETWFSNLIGNADILKDTKIDLHQISEMVMKTVITMWKVGTDVNAMNLMDAGIMRFPDISRPYFAVYRIFLAAKTSHYTSVFYQYEESTIVGAVQREVFLPDKKYINSLTRDLMNDLINEVENLFDDF